MKLIKKHIKALEMACSAFKVDELYVFGSVLTDKFNARSDIDFIVSIFSDDPIEYAENYFDLKFELEKIFGRKIDLLEQKSVKSSKLEYLINQQKKLIYARNRQSLA